MKYIRKFSTPEDREAYMASTPVPDMPYMHLVESTGEVKFSSPEVDYPLYIKALGNLTVKFGNTYEYSKDNVTWTSATSSTSISAIAGERVFFRASGLTASSSSGIGSFTISNGDCNVGGNVMSMVYGADFKGKTEITQTYQFYKLFDVGSNTGYMRIVDASRLAFPATTLTDGCYGYMFQDQRKLTYPPALPAMVLAYECYRGMFVRCTSLVNAPALPATSLGDGCYRAMFYQCTSLVNPPALPSTILKEHCYNNMFYGCQSLVTAPMLPAKTLLPYCYIALFRGCTSLVNPPKIGATVLAEHCCESMFRDCTSLTKTPDLLATILQAQCYYYMFSGCSNLVYVKAMFLKMDATEATTSWLRGVSSNGTFVKNSAATWNVSGESGIPSKWTVELADA